MKAVNPSAGILNAGDLEQELAPMRKAGKQIVFTNGCFDILHSGHVRYLTAAKLQGDILVVGLNSDRSVQLIKGANRPIIEQGQRAEVLAALRFVDYVTFFDESDPLRLIASLRPDILVKGADWPLEKIIGADFIRKNGGRVVRIPVVPDISTSVIIARIRERF
jgi:D-beta-D-heptose 7-phosphate kinase/D-beta-D-heptose 1-phosphate adenosyltransferase